MRSLLFLLCYIGFSVGIYAQSTPTITSFSPASGAVGTIVTLNGTNFSTTAANNIVYFGSVKAVVSTSPSPTATQIKVTVPAGATYDYITVTVMEKSGSSKVPFRITNTALQNFPITTTMFNTPAELTQTQVTVYGGSSQVVVADFNNDGKPDLAKTLSSPGNLHSYIVIYKNTATTSATLTSTNLSLDQTINLSHQYAQYINLKAIDLNGDGKLDLIGGDDYSGSGSGVKALLNTSSGTTISFDSPVHIGVWDYLGKNAFGDFNMDGKPDMVAQQGEIYLNTSTNSTISFSLSHTLSGIIETYSMHPTDLQVGDIDGDGKPDIILVQPNVYDFWPPAWTSEKIYVIRNTFDGSNAFSSTNSFAAPSSFVLTINGVETKNAIGLADMV